MKRSARRLGFAIDECEIALALAVAEKSEDTRGQHPEEAAPGRPHTQAGLYAVHEYIVRL